MSRIPSIIVIFVLGLLFWQAFDLSYGEGVEGISDYYIEQGIKDTGSINIVTAIILNYRAYDTLGETMILFAAITGVAALALKGVKTDVNDN